MKPVDFTSYSRIKKFSYNDFNRWIIEVYKSAYEDGARDNPIKDDCAAILDEDRLYEILISVGIDEQQANDAVDLILEEGVDYEF